MLLGGVVFLLMMVFGLIMRAAQGGLIDLDPTLFYQLLTAHGAGIVGSAAGAEFTGRQIIDICDLCFKNERVLATFCLLIWHLL